MPDLYFMVEAHYAYIDPQIKRSKSKRTVYNKVPRVSFLMYSVEQWWKSNITDSAEGTLMQRPIHYFSVSVHLIHYYTVHILQVVMLSCGLQCFASHSDPEPWPAVSSWSCRTRSQLFFCPVCLFMHCFRLNVWSHHEVPKSFTDKCWESYLVIN